ncbi:MAG: VTT domain-containing protein [Fimbriimonadaceae bacterium]
MIDFILNLDKHVEWLLVNYHEWTYAILAAIVFAESAFVIFPFLPGDSLLFTAGFFCSVRLADGSMPMNIWLLGAMLIAAAILGNDINYRMGKRFGRQWFSKGTGRFFNQSNLTKTEAFFEKHGAKAIIMARFVPFVRSFAPFFAGMADMDRAKFNYNSVVGAIIWVAGFLVIGYWFGSIPWVRDNLHWAVLIVIALTLVPIAVEVWRHKKAAKRESARQETVDEAIDRVQAAVED